MSNNIDLDVIVNEYNIRSTCSFLNNKNRNVCTSAFQIDDIVAEAA